MGAMNEQQIAKMEAAAHGHCPRCESMEVVDTTGLIGLYQCMTCGYKLNPQECMQYDFYRLEVATQVNESLARA